MNYVVTLSSGVLNLSNTEGFDSTQLVSGFNNPQNLSVNLGNFLTNKNLILSIVPESEDLIELPFKLTLVDGSIISKGVSVDIDLALIHEAINQPNNVFFEFGGAIINKHRFAVIVPNENYQPDAQ